jgi:ATP-dependent Clp protease adaptor protein ClpS
LNRSRRGDDAAGLRAWSGSLERSGWHDYYVMGIAGRAFGKRFPLTYEGRWGPAVDDRTMIRLPEPRIDIAWHDMPAPRLADDDRKKRGEPGQPGSAVITKTRPQTKRPSMYRVLLLNDDYTPMEFVVHVLERFFNKDRESATRIMLHVHQNGIGECGIFTYEVAETKVTQVMDFARKHQHPLQCVMEKK